MNQHGLVGVVEAGLSLKVGVDDIRLGVRGDLLRPFVGVDLRLRFEDHSHLRERKGVGSEEKIVDFRIPFLEEPHYWFDVRPSIRRAGYVDVHLKLRGAGAIERDNREQTTYQAKPAQERHDADST